MRLRISKTLAIDRHRVERGRPVLEQLPREIPSASERNRRSEACQDDGGDHMKFNLGHELLPELECSASSRPIAADGPAGGRLVGAQSRAPTGYAQVCNH